MIALKRGFLSIGCRTCQMLKYSSINTNYEGLTLYPKFTIEEQAKILEILNTSNTEQLSRFDVTQGRIKNLENWRNKKGPFKTLADILEVDGLGVKVLEKLCESIVSEDNNDATINIKSTNNFKNRRQFLTPQLDSDAANTLSSAIAFHLGPTSISWAKICRTKNELEYWGFHDFSVYPKKMLPTDTFRLCDYSHDDREIKCCLYSHDHLATAPLILIPHALLCVGYDRENNGERNYTDYRDTNASAYFADHRDNNTINLF